MVTSFQPEWDAAFSSRSPMYLPLHSLADDFKNFYEWPSLSDYQALLLAQVNPVTTLSSKPLVIVAQGGKPQHFEQQYAPRIYMTGEIQTRTENWHDFFQLLSWIAFPQTKALINSIHIPLARQRIAAGGDLGRRTPVENMLSLFDEGGAIIVSSDDSLLQLVRDFKWKELFWQRREELASKFQCVTFGHALYEKGLAPYLGMTANCVLLSVKADFFSLSAAAQLNQLDERIRIIFNDQC